MLHRALAVGLRPGWRGSLVAIALSLAAAGQATAGDISPARGLSDPATFPIGVWLQRPEHAQRYQALGINLYVGLWKGPTRRQLELLKKAAMPVICEQNELALAHEFRAVVAGWMTPYDEPDNAQAIKDSLRNLVSGGRVSWREPVSPLELQGLYRQIKARDKSRPVFVGLGKGVAWDAWKGRGVRTGHPEDYAAYVQAADIVSFDIYPDAESDAQLFGRLELVAQGVDRLKRWAGPDRKVWAVIGASPVKNANAVVDPARIRSQVWMSIINGARGIVYFVHQFEPKFVEAYWFDRPELAAAMMRINARVEQLAPVINAPAAAEVIELVARDGAQPLDARASFAFTARRQACSTFVFATSLHGKPVVASIRLRPDGAELTGTVLDEHRTVATNRTGWFSDSFGPYETHLYEFRRTPGSAGRCGKPS